MICGNHNAFGDFFIGFILDDLFTIFFLYLLLIILFFWLVDKFIELFTWNAMSGPIE